MKRAVKLSCRDTRKMLQDCADGEPISEGLAEHLSRCPRCRSLDRFLRSYPEALAKALARRTRSLPDAKLADLLPLSRSKSATGVPRQRSSARWAIPAAAAALLAA